jgi:hypothetical protein
MASSPPMTPTGEEVFSIFSFYHSEVIFNPYKFHDLKIDIVL